MDNLCFPQITVSYKDADSSRRTLIRSSKDSYNYPAEHLRGLHAAPRGVLGDVPEQLRQTARRILRIQKRHKRRSRGYTDYPPDGTDVTCDKHHPLAQPSVREQCGLQNRQQSYQQTEEGL